MTLGPMHVLYWYFDSIGLCFLRRPPLLVLTLSPSELYLIGYTTPIPKQGPNND